MEIKKDYFWGTINGEKPDKDMNKIIKINVEDCTVEDDLCGLGKGFLYIWKLPDPDFTVIQSSYYREAKYGITWAWELEDFRTDTVDVIEDYKVDNVTEYLLNRYRKEWKLDEDQKRVDSGEQKEVRNYLLEKYKEK